LKQQHSGLMHVSGADGSVTSHLHTPGSLARLRVLKLSYNQILSFPAEFARLTRYQTPDLSATYMHADLCATHSLQPPYILRQGASGLGSMV